MLQLPWYSLTGIVLIFQLLVPASARADETANAPSLARGPRLAPIGDALLTLTQAESLAQTHAPWLAHHRTNASAAAERAA